MSDQSPKISIIMGSQSDWDTMKHAADILETLSISFETNDFVRP